MKKIILILISITFHVSGWTQTVSPEYQLLIKKAELLYEKRQYLNSAKTYSSAFELLKWKGYQNDRYNAACAWTHADVNDSAFFQLQKITTVLNFSEYEKVTSDSDLIALHTDVRWIPLIQEIKQNKVTKEVNYMRPLVARLDSIFEDDQKFRRLIQEIEEKYGAESKEMKNNWKIIHEKDSVNLIKVTAILDEYGWLGSDKVSAQGNDALFLVIQHADLKTQEKYLPMMREAVKNKKAKGSSLALLEDRVALRQGRKQIYGSQISGKMLHGKMYVLPLEDPDHVNERRESVGLEPLENYLKYWNLSWDVNQYKMDLPSIEDNEK